MIIYVFVKQLKHLFYSLVARICFLPDDVLTDAGGNEKSHHFSLHYALALWMKIK